MDPRSIQISVTYDGFRSTVVHISAETFDGALLIAEGRATRHPDDVFSEAGVALATLRAWDKFGKLLRKGTNRVLNGGEFGG